MTALHASAGGGRFTVALAVAAGVVCAFQVGKVPVALDALRQELALDIAAASWLMSAFALIGAAGGVASGMLADRLGARTAALAGLSLQALGSALGALSPGAAMLLATRVLEGLGFLVVVVAAPVLIDRAASPARKPRAMAAWSTFMPVGMCIVMLGAPLLEALGWRPYWGLNAALLLGAAVLLAAGTPRDRMRAARPPAALRTTLPLLLRHAAPWRLAMLFLLFSASYFAVFAFLPSVLAERWQLGTATSSMLVALAVFAAAGGNLLAGRWLARGVRPYALITRAFAALALCAPGIFSEALPAPAAYVLCVAFSAACGLIPTTLFHLAPAASPSPALVGATFGWMMQGNNLGLLLGPVAAGAAAAWGGWTMASWLVAGMAAAGAGIAAVARSAVPPVEDAAVPESG